MLMYKEWKLFYFRINLGMKFDFVFRCFEANRNFLSKPMGDDTAHWQCFELYFLSYSLVLLKHVNLICVFIKVAPYNMWLEISVVEKGVMSTSKQ